MDKKKYSADELLMYAYKYNKIPCVLFAKDKHCRYIYTSEVEKTVNGGEENSIIGKTDLDIQYDPKLGKMYYEQDLEIMRSGKGVHCYSEFYIDGKKEVREISKNPVYSNGEIIGVCGVVSDVTELMNLKERYEKLSMYDSYTGCYNRNYFQKQDFESKDKLPCAYIMCDCNDLKLINDQLGHDMGDQYIRKAFQILREAVEKDSVIVRWGGDEFLMITPRCNKTVHEKMIEKIKIFQVKLAVIKPEMGLATGGEIRETLAVPESEVSRQADYNMYKDKELMHAVNAQIKDCMDNRSGGLRQYG